MTEKKRKRQLAINWVAIIGALGGTGAGVNGYFGNGTDSKLKYVMARELAAYKEWKSSATKDLEMLEAENKKMAVELAAVTATVQFLSAGNRSKARPIAAALAESVARAAPAVVEEVGYIEVESTAYGRNGGGARAPPRPRGAHVAGTFSKSASTNMSATVRAEADAVFESKIKSDDEIEISDERVQRHVESLF